MCEGGRGKREQMGKQEGTGLGKEVDKEGRAKKMGERLKRDKQKYLSTPPPSLSLSLSPSLGCSAKCSRSAHTRRGDLHLSWAGEEGEGERERERKRKRY